MDQFNMARKVTDERLLALEDHILNIRQRGQYITQRHSNLLERQRDLTGQNGRPNIKGSDKIHLNVGGTEMSALREMLTLIKGSRLDVLFSGRWDNQLLRDEKDRIFLDLDARYFKKIVEHLSLMNENKDGDRSDLNWPTFSDEDEQKTLDLYIDLFHLRGGRSDNDHETEDDDDKPDDKEQNKEQAKEEKYDEPKAAKCYKDLVDALNHEEQDLNLIENGLDEMEKDIIEEEQFVSFFTTTFPQPQLLMQETMETQSYNDSYENLSLCSMASGVYSISDSNSNHQLHDDVESSIMNLWIDGEIISVKRSTLCLCEGSPLADNFNDDAWMNRHTLKTEDGRSVVLIEHSYALGPIINQLRLRSMMVTADDLPGVKIDKVLSLRDIISKLFADKEDYIVVAKSQLDSQIITSQSENDQIASWLKEVNRMSEPKLLYRASCDGWSARKFHSKCDGYSNTLVIVKTGKGFVFGGYSDQSWKGNDGEYKSSMSSFLFSVKCYAGLKPTKMKVKSGHKEKAVYASNNYGPCFGNTDIEIGKNNDMRKGFTEPNDAYDIPSGASKTFLTGKTGSDQRFHVIELEVFEV